MISERLIEYIKKRYIKIEEDAKELLSFEGFVYSRPCYLILTDRRIARICRRVGFPQRRRVYLEETKLSEEKSNGDYVLLRLSSPKRCLELVIYPSFAAVIKKKLGAV